MARNLQGNAADPQQVKYAARKEAQRAARFLDALRSVLRMPEGRIVCWELLARAGVFRSIWDPSARIHYNAGKQDYGHELLGVLLEADEVLYVLMEREARAYVRQGATEAAAVQTAAAEESSDGG